MAKREYVSMRGKKIDLELLKKMNELVPAVGNARVNARGDELGPGGKIIRKREDIMKDYYQSGPNQVIQESTKRKEKPIAETTTPTATVSTTPVSVENTTAIMDQLTAEEKVLFNDDWAEDSEGNFVKKEKTTRKPKAE